MTDLQFERTVEAFLVEAAPARVPGDLHEAVVTAAARTPQRLPIARVIPRASTRGKTLALAAALHAEGHPMMLRDGGETVAHRLDGSALPDHVEHDPHEEAVALRVVELVGVEDVAAVLEEMRGNGGDDPRAVGAG